MDANVKPAPPTNEDYARWDRELRYENFKRGETQSISALDIRTQGSGRESVIPNKNNKSSASTKKERNYSKNPLSASERSKDNRKVGLGHSSSHHSSRTK